MWLATVICALSAALVNFAIAASPLSERGFRAAEDLGDHRLKLHPEYRNVRSARPTNLLMAGRYWTTPFQARNHLRVHCLCRLLRMSEYR